MAAEAKLSAKNWTVLDHKSFWIGVDGRVVEDDIRKAGTRVPTISISIRVENRFLADPLIIGRIVAQGRVELAVSEVEPGRSYTWVYDSPSGKRCWLGVVPRIEEDRAIFDLPDNDGTWLNAALLD